MENKELVSILDSLITNHVSESEIVEYKENFFDAVKIGKYISALSNSATIKDEKRAFVFWGIQNETLKVVGTSFNPHAVKVKNENFISWLSQMTNGFDFEFRKIEYENKNIVVLIIPAAKWIETKFKGVAYIRMDSTTLPLDDFPDKKRMLWKKLVKNSFEEEIALQAVTADQVLQLLNFNTYYELLNRKVPEQKDDILTMLVNEGCISKKSSYSNLFDITNLGAILFARSFDNFKTLQQKAIRIIKYNGINRLNASSDVTFDEGYASSFKKILSYLMGILPGREEFKDGIREVKPAYPEIIFRELIPNAMMHQDFLIKGQQPRIEVFEDRVEILNAGEPLIPVNRFLDMAPISRNEQLAKVMHKLHICEERGSGIDRIFEAIERNKMPAPNFRSENYSVTATVFINKKWENYTREDKINLCYQHCCYLYYLEHKAMTNQSLRERFNFGNKDHSVISRIIKDTKDAKLIKNTQENSKKYIPYWA